jgi:hypothetical protein
MAAISTMLPNMQCIGTTRDARCEEIEQRGAISLYHLYYRFRNDGTPSRNGTWSSVICKSTASTNILMQL